MCGEVNLGTPLKVINLELAAHMIIINDVVSTIAHTQYTICVAPSTTCRANWYGSSSTAGLAH